MKELEKILEEIRAKAIELKNNHWGDDERHLTGKGVEVMCIQAEQIIRKHMNDGWIPVEERLPEVTEEDIIPVEVTTMGGLRTVGCYFEYMNEWYALDGDSKLDVIAWKEPSEPYQPERSKE